MFRNRGLHVLAALWLLPFDCRAKPDPSWVLAADEHFEIYCDAGPDAARSTLASFEQLRTWFLERTRLSVGDRPAVRVLAFRSSQEYNQYRISGSSDAHYIGTESQDFIAMPLGGKVADSAFALAAHEYAHLMLHASGFQLPPWLSEGLAEFFSTIRISEQDSTLGGPITARLQLLRRKPWVSLDVVLSTPASSPLRQDRQWNEMFYAESWALTDMLVLSADYAPRFDTLVSESFGLQHVYGKPVSTIERDLWSWISRKDAAPVTLPALGARSPNSANVTPTSNVAVNAVIAEMLMTSGEIGRAQSMYKSLREAEPKNPEVLGGLGTIALLQGDSRTAVELWKAALASGVRDASLCYRYAVLAEGVVPAEETRPVFERAIALRPGFDDARYALALSLNNAREFEPALEQLNAMRYISPARRFAYWAAVAYACEEIGRRPEAIAAASMALDAASTPEEQARARQLKYLAQTDLTVQVISDSDGHTKFATARKPHNTENWNPFVEPSDQIKTVDGELSRVDCLQGKVVAVGVALRSGRLSLSVPDPTHVQVLNSLGQFSCGPQGEPPNITIVYAALQTAESDGIVRGIEFHTSASRQR